MRWNKLGQIYSHRSLHPKMRSHASNPLAVHLEEGVYRVFFSARDERNRSSVGAVDIDIVNRRIVQKHDEPFFLHGNQGSFFEAGVSIGCTYEHAGKSYMLFMAWQNAEGQHWRGDIGRLEITSDRTLELAEDRPYLTSDATDPISLSYPWIEKSSDGRYMMWYGSTQTWDAGNGEMLHTINFATSEDSIHWNRLGVSVPYKLGQAQAFSRPTVLRTGSGSYRMWYSYRGGAGDKYRIGFATSENGREWTPHNAESGISVSAQGWDSEMIEYPFVFQHSGSTYMLYNGNDYGRDGFGLAVLEE